MALLDFLLEASFNDATFTEQDILDEINTFLFAVRNMNYRFILLMTYSIDLLFVVCFKRNCRSSKICIHFVYLCFVRVCVCVYTCINERDRTLYTTVIT